MSQRVAIVLDQMGTMGQTPEDERDEILDDLRRRSGLDPKLVWYGNDPHQLPDTSIDLLVIDFGAITVGYGGGGADWTKWVIGYAEEHPGVLVMLWSGMTADAVGTEMSGRAYSYGESMEKWAAWPDNVRALHAGYAWDVDWKGPAGDNDSMDWYGDSMKKLRDWFGIEGKTPDEQGIEDAGPLVPPGRSLIEQALAAGVRDPEELVGATVTVALEEDEDEVRVAAMNLESVVLDPIPRDSEQGRSLDGPLPYPRAKPGDLVVVEDRPTGRHPTVNGRALQIYDRVRVRDHHKYNDPTATRVATVTEIRIRCWGKEGREQVWGGHVTDLPVHGERWADRWTDMPIEQVWISLDNSSEIFHEDDIMEVLT